jgi:hypothetical protein
VRVAGNRHPLDSRRFRDYAVPIRQPLQSRTQITNPRYQAELVCPATGLRLSRFE